MHSDHAGPLSIPGLRGTRGKLFFFVSSEEIRELRAPATMRDFFKARSDQIHYVTVENASILADLDTPEDYRKYQA